LTTKIFLSEFGFKTLEDLPDFAALEDAGQLSKERLLQGIFCLEWRGGKDDKRQ
jgi:hypothetical protein